MGFFSGISLVCCLGWSWVGEEVLLPSMNRVSEFLLKMQELQHERDALQERMSEQLVRISSLQSRLDEQRHRAEEIHRQGTSDLNIRVHDLQVSGIFVGEDVGDFGLIGIFVLDSWRLQASERLCRVVINK